MKTHIERGVWSGIPCSKCDKVLWCYSALRLHINKCHPLEEDLICDVRLFREI